MMTLLWCIVVWKASRLIVLISLISGGHYLESTTPFLVLDPRELYTVKSMDVI